MAEKLTKRAFSGLHFLPEQGGRSRPLHDIRKGNGVILRAVRPNAGLEAAYRAELYKLVDEMQKSVVYWLRAAYRANEPEIAMDKSPAETLREVMRRLSRRWQARFDEAAPALAKYFSQKIKDRTDSQLRQILKEGGFSISFTMTREMNDVMQAAIGAQVSLIRNLSQQHLKEIEGLVMRSVSTGRDLATLSKELQARYDMTKRRAATISLDQNNKATATMNRARQLGLGLDEAVWIHSHAGSKPRREHVAWGANQKRYKIAEGMWSEVDQAYVWPGTAVHCRCVSRPILKGLS